MSNGITPNGFLIKDALAAGLIARGMLLLETKQTLIEFSKILTEDTHCIFNQSLLRTDDVDITIISNKLEQFLHSL